MIENENAVEVENENNKLNKYIDQTLLKAFATKEEIKALCDSAKEYDFMSVCINPCFVKFAKNCLDGSSVKVCTVIGFPLGANMSSIKRMEAKKAIEDGADEVDMVINIGMLKEKNYDGVFEDIKAVREVSLGKILKVIIETCYLDKDEIIKACELSKMAGADFVKTSTGFGTSGAKEEDVKLMRKVVESLMGVKASGGIRTKEDAIRMINSGASRIGTSNGVDIVK